MYIDENVALTSASSYDNDVNVICGLVKMYFRELDEPLLMFSNYNDFIAASDLKDELARIEKIKTIINERLPMPHRDLLYILLRHLRK